MIHDLDKSKLFNLEQTKQLEYLLKDCVPRVKEKLKLSEVHEFFLERVADIVFRPDKDDRAREYVVRYPEFLMSAEKFRQDKHITEAFGGLKVFLG